MKILSDGGRILDAILFFSTVPPKGIWGQQGQEELYNIFDTIGRKQKDYAWGIGKKYNNGEEWLALIKGVEIASHCGIEELAVFGDSLMVVREARKPINNYKSP